MNLFEGRNVWEIFADILSTTELLQNKICRVCCFSDFNQRYENEKRMEAIFQILFCDI